MPRHRVKYIIAAALAAAALMAIATTLARQQRQEPLPPQHSQYEEKRALVEALRRGGLREAARLKGSYVSRRDPHPDWLSLDLEQLTKYSEAVVVGVPTLNRCKLSYDGQTILTVYEVTVREVIKGYLQPGGVIKVGLLGGKVRFNDGTTAEVETPGFQKMVNGKTYALYLNSYKTGDASYDESRQIEYELTAGPQGLIELPGDGTPVKSQARATDPVRREIKDKSVEAFLAAARRLAAEHPMPAKCCSH